MSEPISFAVPASVIFAAVKAVNDGIQYAEMMLTEHEANFGRTTLKNKTWAERMEQDIREMKASLSQLKEYRA